jgi:hypothetical protein
VISLMMMTGSNPQPNSIGGQLSSKSLAVEAFTRRWYHTCCIRLHFGFTGVHSDVPIHERRTGYGSQLKPFVSQINDPR